MNEKKTRYNQKRNVYTQNYIHEHYKQLAIRLPTAGDVTREKIQVAAAAAGESVNAFIIDAVRVKMNAAGIQGPATTGDGEPEKENTRGASDHIGKTAGADPDGKTRGASSDDPGENKNARGASSVPEENPAADPDGPPEPVRVPFIEDP